MTAAGTGAGTRRGWYHGWNIVAVCILAQIAGLGLSVNAFSLFLKDWSADLHTPISTFQLSLMAMACVGAVVSPLFGALADKYPARRLFAFGLAGVAAFHFAMGAVTAAWQVVALYGLLLPVALAAGAALVANAVVSRWFVRSRGLALGLTAFGIGAAGVVLPLLIAAAPAGLGWRTIWIAGGVVTAVIVLPLVLLVVRDRPTERDGLRYLSAESAAPTGLQPDAEALRWRDILTRRNFWLLLAVTLPIMAAYGGVAQNLAPIALSHGFSQHAAGVMISALGLAHVAATLGFGLLSDRFGNRLPFFALAMIVAAAALLVAFGRGLPAVGAGAALVGLGGGLYTLLAAAIAAEFGAAGFGRAYGLGMCFVPVTSLAPFLTAKVQEATGSYAPALAALALLTVAGGGLVLLLRESRGAPAAAPVAESAAAAAE